MSATIATTFQNPIPRMLEAARNELQIAQLILAHVRAGNHSTESSFHRRAVARFYAALDRVHEVQCMTIVSF